MKINFATVFTLMSALMLAVSPPPPVNADRDQLQQSRKEIYHQGWIDLNKNGRMDVYENPKAPIDKRIDDLLRQMNLDEKTCQTATVYGVGRGRSGAEPPLKDELPTPEWKHRLWKDGIANIDEHLNGIGPNGKSVYATDIKKHVWAMNEVQRFFMEETQLGIPVDFTNEGLRGLAFSTATSFPSELGQGHTWDKELISEIGRIEADEARSLGYTNVYAPTLDVSRDQRWGRIEDTYGEDPYLVSRLGVEMTKAMQKNYQIASTAKHFAIYSIAKGAREGQARTDPQATLHEVENIFLPPFKAVIKEAGLLGVMSSYNDYDGTPVTGSHYWLTERLRNEFGFRGYVVSDSAAVEYLYNKHGVATDMKDAVRQSIEAGLNVKTNFTPPEDFVLPLRELVKEGKVSMKTLDDRVRDVLRVKFVLGIFDHPYVTDAENTERIVNSAAHQQVALRAALESMVLLKNDRNILPLSTEIKSIAVVVLGDSMKTVGESASRTSLDLPGHQLDLVQAVYASGKPVVVVLINGRPLSINWIDKHVPGIIEAWFPGVQGGTAIADVLFGDYNPGGKLAVTFPKTAGQIPYNFPTKPNAQWEGEKTRVSGALYYFGHGLSYTTFAYGNLRISTSKQMPRGNVTVSFDLKNTGAREGDEVVQLYTRDLVSSVTTYEKNLRGFERIHLKPGESRTLTFTLTPDDLALWNREMHFVVEPGAFRVMIGASSEDIRLNGEFSIIAQGGRR